jgi:hypothetical protein
MTNPSEPVRKKPSQAAKKKNRPNIQSAHPPKPVKKTPSRAAKKAAQYVITSQPKKTNTKRRNIIAITSIVLVLVLIVGLFYYFINVLPMQTVVLTVNNENVSTGYFLKRVVANPSGDINSTIQLLEVELIVKQRAPAEGVSPITDAAIDDYLRGQASSTLVTNTTADTGTTTATTTTEVSSTTPATSTTTTPVTTTATTATTTATISDAEFNKWLKEQLSNTGLLLKEYREVISREIQRQRLTDITSASIPSSMAQVHLWAIPFNSQSAALAAKVKIDSGTEFSTVANTIAGQTNGGDQGWLPLSVLPSALNTAASTLEVGKCSDPIAYTQSSSSSSSGTTSYVLLLISEKSDSMPVTPSQLSVLKNNTLNNWLNLQLQSTIITLHNRNGTPVDGMTGTLDNTTLTWLNYQAQKLSSKRPSSTATTTTTPTSTSTTTTTTELTTSTTTTPITTTTSTATTSP